MNSFEGSFLGQADRIDRDTVLECGVCWSTYDPAIGDPVWQIPAGTAFSELPDHWRCPHCDAPREQFMVLEAGGGDLAASGAEGGLRKAERSLHGRMLRALEKVAGRMESLPVYRSDLPLGVLGPRPCDAGDVALVYTPWSMHLVLIADSTERLVEGSERTIELPSGSYPFVRGFLEGVGAVENCSLFSPMEAFESSAAVVAVARAAFDELFKGDEVSLPASAQDAPNLSAEAPDNPARRSFITGGAARL